MFKEQRGPECLERVGRIELHSAQLGRLATHLELTRKNYAALRLDKISFILSAQ